MIPRLTLRSKPLFFLCDIQERFRPLIHDFPAAVHTASKLLQAANILNIKVVATEQYPQALGNIVKELDISKAALVDQKTKFSMLTPKVKTYLNSEDTNSVVLFGIEAHVCVLQTALDLRALDYDVFVVADGISSTNKSEIKIAVERMKSAGCVVTTSDSLLFELMIDSKQPGFKEISNLVKKSMESEHHNKLLSNL